MNSGVTNGEYIVMGSCDEHSEVKLLMITEGVFLCVGDVHIESALWHGTKRSPALRH